MRPQRSKPVVAILTALLLQIGCTRMQPVDPAEGAALAGDSVAGTTVGGDGERERRERAPGRTGTLIGLGVSAFILSALNDVTWFPQ